MAAFDLAGLDLDAISARERRAAGGSWAVWIFAVLLAFAWLVPFYYLLVSVFKSNAEYGTGNPLALPHSIGPLADNIAEAWSKARMAEGMFNSALYGICGAGAAVFIAALAAYGLTRIEFRGKGFWFVSINRSRSDGLSGFVGRIIRGKVRGEAEKGMVAVLAATKSKLEGK